MTIPQTKIMLCNCGKSMPLDGKAINEACGQADAGSDLAHPCAAPSRTD